MEWLRPQDIRGWDQASINALSSYLDERERASAAALEPAAPWTALDYFLRALSIGGLVVAPLAFLLARALVPTFSNERLAVFFVAVIVVVVVVKNLQDPPTQDRWQLRMEAVVVPLLVAAVITYCADGPAS